VRARVFGRRSNLDRLYEIQRLREPDTPSISYFVKETLGSLELEPGPLVSHTRPPVPALVRRSNLGR
jgi:hypothetical protein